LVWTSGDTDVTILNSDEIFARCERCVAEFIAFIHFFTAEGRLGRSIDEACQVTGTGTSSTNIKLGLLV